MNASGEDKQGRHDALAYVRGIVGTVREPLLVLDTDLRVRSANRSFYRTFQVSPQQTEGRLLYDLGNGQWDIPRLRTLLDEVLPHDNAFDDYEVEHAFPGIGHKIMLLNARKLRQEETELILLAIEDVTERRRLEAERREIETRFTSLVKNVQDHSIFTLDPEGRVTSWNVAAERILGFSEAEALGRHFAFIFTPEDRQNGVPEAELHAAREQGRAEDERWHLRKDGERFWALGIVSALHDAEGRVTGFSKILRDMTARKEDEAERERLFEQIQVERDRLAALLTSIPDEVWFADTHRQFVLANPAALGEFRLSMNEPVDVGELAANLEVLRPDGSPRPVEACPPLRALDGERITNEEEIIRTPASGERRYRQVSATPVKDQHGKTIGSVSVVRDITAQKQAEAALAEANRRKDVFLATLAHELRNPLTPIGASLDLIAQLRSDDPALKEPLRVMDHQVMHLVRLVDDLLDVSRVSRDRIQLRRERLDLAEVIDAALEMNEAGFADGRRELNVNVPSQPLPIDGDRVRLTQVVSNLLNNAVKFTNEGGRVGLTVEPKDGRVEIRVEDDGQGIPRERLEDVFELFSQVEPVYGQGLGIGLNLVRSLVAMHGGAVIADSEGPGRGATFTVSLPLCRNVPAEPTPAKAPESDLIAQRRVLVVDDNRDIADGLEQLLTLLKAEVRVAYDGAQALRICEEWLPTHILMDLGMPGMDGFETARQLCTRHPDRSFRLIAFSGWGRDEDRDRALDAGFDDHLVKPVRAAALKALLSE